MGDDDGGHPLLLELQKQIQQGLGVLLVEGGGGLIQNQKARVLGQGLGNFDHLLLADADILDQRLGRLRQADDLQVPGGLGMGLVPVNREFLSLFVSQEHVFTDAHVGHKRQLLVDDDNAFALAVLDVGELAYFSFIYNVSRIAAKGIQTAEYVHQRGLAGAVLTHQGVDAASLDDEVDVVKRFDAGEFLRDPPHFQNVVRQMIPSISGHSRRIRRNDEALPLERDIEAVPYPASAQRWKQTQTSIR